MNILLACSSKDGPNYLAFNLETLNLDLQHHKSIYDAAIFAIEDSKKEFSDREDYKKFGEFLGICSGEINNDCHFIENVLRGEAEFSDPESEDYDSIDDKK